MKRSGIRGGLTLAHTMTPRAARDSERAAAFTLLFRHLDAVQRDFRVARALEMIAGGHLSGDGLIVLHEGSCVGGVILCQVVPGGGGLVWPPILADSHAPLAHEDLLVQAVCAHLRSAGARLAQCLLPDDELLHGGSLQRNGFLHVTGLSYLRHDLSLTAPWLDNDDRVDFTPYDPAAPGLFQATLEQTYAETLDCPEVNGLRAIAEVIEGHQSQGRFDPASWWLVSVDGSPAGVLLMMEQEPDEWEVVYMGVVPAARRRGVGRAMLRHALCHARLAEAQRLTLSVDDRNGPAWQLYLRLGFERYDHREVLLAVFSAEA